MERLFGILGGPCGDIDGSFQVAGLLRSDVEQFPGKDGQNEVEKNEQPISGVVQKSIVPVAFLTSFFCLMAAARYGGRFAGWAVLVVSLGWLCLIVYFGLL